MTFPLIFNAVCVTIQFACLAVNAWCIRLNTRNYNRHHARVFLRLRRLNIALIVWAVVFIVIGIVAIAGEVHV